MEVMGNADLRSLAVIEEIGFDTLGGSVVAVDAHNWLYRYLSSSSTTSSPCSSSTAASRR
jgi:flap endonuclease-1